jgi:hypothetical protein
VRPPTPPPLVFNSPQPVASSLKETSPVQKSTSKGTSSFATSTREGKLNTLSLVKGNSGTQSQWVKTSTAQVYFYNK